MSTDNDWWARRLGNSPQRTPVYPQQQPVYQAPQQQPVHPQAPQAQPQFKVTPENLYEAAMQWQGGQAARTETQPCPQCGGGHYFSRTNGPSRGPAPAPMCYDCGYNGMFIQGDPSVWQGA